MKYTILGLLAETSIHVGVGQDEGGIDLPVAREQPAGYPMIPDSGLKGAVKEKAWIRKYDQQRSAGRSEEESAHDANAETKRRFGSEDHAGRIAFSDARLLLLPVRSLTDVYRWVTCPFLIERYERDILRGTGKAPSYQRPDVRDDEVITAGVAGTTLFLEEFDFTIRSNANTVQAVVDLLSVLIGHAAARLRLPNQLAVVSDKTFTLFAQQGLPIRARNRLSDDHRKVSVNLFYEEALPADTLLYCWVAELVEGSLTDLTDLVRHPDPYLRVGGNETLGQGWLHVTIPA